MECCGLYRCLFKLHSRGWIFFTHWKKIRNISDFIHRYSYYLPRDPIVCINACLIYIHMDGYSSCTKKKFRNISIFIRLYSYYLPGDAIVCIKVCLSYIDVNGYSSSIKRNLEIYLFLYVRIVITCMGMLLSVSRPV